ncbi:MAG: CARDB domain-containing protein [Planctomycetota bacterium]|jgi:uncharacterized repeat protein (TIGR01451 family)
MTPRFIRSLAASAAVLLLGAVTTASAAPAGDVTATVVVEKSAPAEVVLGDPMTYTVKVTNRSSAAVSNVVVVDTLPAGFKVASTNPSGATSGNKITWNVASLGAGQSRSFEVRGQATTTASLESCVDVTWKTSTCTTTRVIQPKLSLTKTAPADVLLCDTIPITYVVSNPGTGAATNVKISDKLAAGLTAAGKSTVDMAVGTLAPGQSRTFTVNATASKTGTFASTAAASADRNLSANDGASTIVRQPILNITKTAPTRSFIGRPVSYTITVRNTGDAPSRDTVVVDTLPGAAIFTSASDNGAHSNGRVTWNLGTLAAGASRTLTAEVTSRAAATFLNVVKVNGACATEAVAQATTAVEGIPALLLEVADLDDPIEIGSDVTYVIVVTNQGTAADDQIEISATLPSQEGFVSATGPTKHTVTGQTVKFAQSGPLAPKAALTYRITVKAKAEGDVRFAISMDSKALTSPVKETEATRLY